MSLKKNALANYLGQGWTALMGLAFIPVYIRYLGVEAWGLVGFMSMLQAWLSLLDIGLTPTITREMARFTAGAHSTQSIRDLLRSLEWVYGGVALVVVLGVALAAPWLVDHWLKSEHLARADVILAIRIMGLVLATRMAQEVYRGAIRGLQRMVWLNSADALLATLRWAGAVAMLAWVDTSIDAFFLWQGVVSVLAVAILGLKTAHLLPKAETPARFNFAALLSIRRFAAGMVATTFLALMLTQVDKLLLSTLLPLTRFGYYMLATTVAGALSLLVMPLATAAAPRLSELVARSDAGELIVTYHRASQWMAAVLIPPALVLVAFAEPILWAWTGDARLAQESAPLLAPLALGTMLNGFMHIPYQTQLAHGWTGLAVRVNLVAVTLIVPAILWAVPRFGAIGAAWAWLALNAGYVMFAIHFMHRRLLPNEKGRWYRDAIFKPLIAGATIALLVKPAWPVAAGRIMTALLLVLTAAVTAVVVAAVTREPRTFLLGQLSRLREVFAHG